MKEQNTFKLLIEDLRIFAYHGWYAEEQQLGGWYEVNVSMTLGKVADDQDDIDNTVNYEQVVQHVKERMSIKHKLIEKVADDLFHTLLMRFENILDLELKLSKINPPVKGVEKTTIVRSTSF